MEGNQNDSDAKLKKLAKTARQLSGVLRDIAVAVGRRSPAYSEIQEVAEELYNAAIAE